MKLLTAEQKAFYDNEGYIVLDLLTESEINNLSNEYDSIFKRHTKQNLDAEWPGDWKTQEKVGVVKSIHGMQNHSALFTKLLLNDKLLDAVEDIMETPNVLLHHTKAHLKPPGVGSPFPMHQDYHYFPFKKHSMLAIFISMDASDPENGGLCVIPGSHKLGPQRDASTVVDSHYLDPKEFPIKNATPLSLKRGQIVIFSYLLIHGSYDNKSNRPRRMHLIQLMSAEDEPTKGIHKSVGQGMVLRGVNVNRDADITKRHINNEAA